jgi:hypothetical protein
MEAKGHNGTVEFDGQTVTIKRSGTLARMSRGKGEKQIAVGSIAAVQWKPAGAFVNGFIQFTVPGAVEQRSKPGSRTYDEAKDDNAVLFTKSQMKHFEALRAAIEDARRRPASLPPPAAPAASPAAAPSPADQLRQLAALRDEGLITEEEFQAKRADLINRM